MIYIWCEVRVSCWKFIAGWWFWKSVPFQLGDSSSQAFDFHARKLISFTEKKTYWWDVIFIMACNSILLITLTSSSHLLGGETVNFLGKFLSEGEHWYHDRCSNALPQVEIYLGMFPLPKKNREECRLIGMIVTSPYSKCNNPSDGWHPGVLSNTPPKFNIAQPCKMNVGRPVTFPLGPGGDFWGEELLNF